MEEIKIFSKSMFLDKEIDVWGAPEKPYFRANDVQSWLRLKNVSDAVSRVDSDERVKFNLSRGGSMWFLTEDGLYELLMQSRKPIAKQFRKGVKQILHEIRTKGGYLASHEADTPEMIMARALKVADETIKRNEQRVRELEAKTEQQQATIGLQQKEIVKAAPKVKYYDDTLASEDCLTTTQVADDLGITARALNKMLAEAGIQYYQSKCWHLKGKYREWKLASTRTYPYPKSNGSIGTSVQLVWNQRGKRFILALYNNNFDVKAAIAEINGEKAAENNQSNN